MKLYDIIFNWFNENIFISDINEINNVNVSVSSNNTLSLMHWLSHTMTIITLLTLVIVLYIFVKWIFKVFSGLFYR